MVEHEATVVALDSALNPPRAFSLTDICNCRCSDLIDIAEWIHANDGLEPAKRLCEFLLSSRNYMKDSESTRARQLIIKIIMDDRYPVEDRAGNLRMICKYLLEQAAAKHTDSTIN